jgi:zinc D-Ala-D-Ala carboxypeptidase
MGTIVHPAPEKLQALRTRLGKPLIVRSANRSREHNRDVSCTPRSKHMAGPAFDITMSNHDPATFEAATRAVGFLGFSFCQRSGFMNIDLGPARVREIGLRRTVVAFATASNNATNPRN